VGKNINPLGPAGGVVPISTAANPVLPLLPTAEVGSQTTGVAGVVQCPDGHPLVRAFGTDGGVHNFMRELENWGAVNMNYTGSLVCLFTNRQAVGLYKSGGGVYSPPVRNYTFDSNFLNPTLLPPRAPLFRDVNTTGFTQLLGPTQ
jgi:hypothetical protein